MSPTYWTASRIKNAAVANGWEIVPSSDGQAPWGVKKGRLRVMVQERRDGGLLAVWVHRQVSGGSDATYFPPRYKGKLELVLRHIEEGEWLAWWMDDKWLQWWKSLDHTNCANYAPARFEDAEKFFARPFYQQCGSMHCPDCGKATGGQGHRFCPEKKTSDG